MTNETLAGYANLSLYSAMAVFTIAMVCHAVYLAGLLPSRDLTRARAQERELVAAGAGAVPEGAGPARSGPRGGPMIPVCRLEDLPEGESVRIATTPPIAA